MANNQSRMDPRWMLTGLARSTRGRIVLIRIHDELNPGTNFVALVYMDTRDRVTTPNPSYPN